MGCFRAFAMVAVLTTAGVVFAAPNPLAKSSPGTLISRGQQLAGEARTLSADMIIVYEGGEHVTASVRLMKPNYVTFPLVGERGPATESVAQAYPVSGGAGSYLIDREGRILWRGRNSTWAPCGS